MNKGCCSLCSAVSSGVLPVCLPGFLYQPYLSNGGGKHASVVTSIVSDATDRVRFYNSSSARVSCCVPARLARQLWGSLVCTSEVCCLSYNAACCCVQSRLSFSMSVLTRSNSRLPLFAKQRLYKNWKIQITKTNIHTKIIIQKLYKNCASRLCRGNATGNITIRPWTQEMYV